MVLHFKFWLRSLCARSNLFYLLLKSIIFQLLLLLKSHQGQQNLLDLLILLMKTMQLLGSHLISINSQRHILLLYYHFFQKTSRTTSSMQFFTWFRWNQRFLESIELSVDIQALFFATNNPINQLEFERIRIIWLQFYVFRQFQACFARFPLQQFATQNLICPAIDIYAAIDTISKWAVNVSILCELLFIIKGVSNRWKIFRWSLHLCYNHYLDNIVNLI